MAGIISWRTASSVPDRSLHSFVHKSHALLGEEIAVALYNMAAVNCVAFCDAFLPQFLHSTDGLDDGQRSILQRNFKTDTVSYI
jgi:hypothetical protein